MQSEVGNAAATKKPPQASPGNLKNKMDRIKYMVISNWMENGFIEQLRGQIRCQIVKELKNPFKNTHHSSHLSIERKILNTIIIDYLKRYRYHYSLSVFKSEIGGQLIGSLSLDDTCQQLRVKEESSIHRDESILERLIHARTAKEDSADTEKRTPSNSIHPNQLEALRKEILCDVEQHTKTVPTSDLQENEWKDKYLNVYQQLLAALNRENELKCLLDENDIKLKSAKREIDYLERLVTAQNHEQKETEHHDDNNFKMKSIGDVYVDEMEQEEHEEEEDEEEQGDADREQEINDIGNTQMLDSNEHSHSVVTSHLDSVSRKYADLELDIKRRLQIQAMLETDSRRLSYRTKEFLNQLNQRKSETTQVMHAWTIKRIFIMQCCC